MPGVMARIIKTEVKTSCRNVITVKKHPDSKATRAPCHETEEAPGMLYIFTFSVACTDFPAPLCIELSHTNSVYGAWQWACAVGVRKKSLITDVQPKSGSATTLARRNYSAFHAALLVKRVSLQRVIHKFNMTNCTNNKWFLYISCLLHKSSTNELFIARSSSYYDHSRAPPLAHYAVISLGFVCPLSCHPLNIFHLSDVGCHFCPPHPFTHPPPPPASRAGRRLPRGGSWRSCYIFDPTPINQSKRHGQHQAVLLNVASALMFTLRCLSWLRSSCLWSSCK